MYQIQVITELKNIIEKFNSKWDEVEIQISGPKTKPWNSCSQSSKNKK